MSIKKRTRVWASGALIAALLVPAGLAAGSHGETSVSGGAPSVILLTLGRTDAISWQSLQPQRIATSNNDCLVVNFNGPEILEITPGGGALGHVKDGFGVMGPNDGSGEPCGRVTPGESISVSLGAAADGYLMSAVDVDLELKFNAAVSISYRHDGVEVAADTFSPGLGSDDGPDSKDGDNYRYFHRPTKNNAPAYFDEVVFSTTAGSFSLEGGADLQNNNAPNAFGKLDPRSKSSQFEVVPVYDGIITCQDELEIAGGSISGVLKMHSMEVDGIWSTDNCPLKPYFSFATDDTIGFIPVLEGTRARYTIVVEATEQAVTQLGGQILSLEALYDPEGDPDPTRPLLACEGQPVVDGEGYEEFWTQADTELIPGVNETACYYSVQLLPTGDGVGTEIWGIYFEDDPSFGFK